MKTSAAKPAAVDTVEKLILQAIADDHDEFVNVLEAVQEGTDNENYSRTQLCTALDKLIKKGLAQSFKFESQKFTAAALTKANCEELWFKATPKGRELVSEDHDFDLDE